MEFGYSKMKKLLLIALLIVSGFSQKLETFQYKQNKGEIPPSVYLSKLIENREKQLVWVKAASGYLSLGFGGLFIQSSNGKNETDWPGPNLGYTIGASLIIYGIYAFTQAFNPKPSKLIIKYNEILLLEDQIEMETQSYLLLDSLATQSRLKLMSKASELQDNPFYIIISNRLTKEEKALDAYKKQIPIEDALN